MEIMEDDAEDYDAIRRKNIAEREAKFAELFKELKKEREQIIEEDKLLTKRDYSDEPFQPPPKRRRLSKETKSWKPGGEVVLEFKRKYNTRSRAKKAVESDSPDSGNEEEEWTEKPSLFKFKGVPKVLKADYDPDTIPSPDEITPEHIANIAKNSTGKVYCKFTGTSCHQCRQKTKDTKTVCRSGQCIGVRGQFCGPCLRLRYGENAVDVLKDPSWHCPPCRGLCNCSICRTRNGQRPTGILAPIAQEEGFSSVLDYLESAQAKEP